MWKLNYGGMSVIDAADRFAADVFPADSPRQIDFTSIRGDWSNGGRNFVGTFSLIGGDKLYRITCQSGLWSVDHAVREGSDV